MSEEASVTIKQVEPKFKLHVFSREIGDKTILYQVVVMKDSLMIFINHKDVRNLNDLSIAMLNRLTNTQVSTKLFGDFVDPTSQALATKVSKKLNKQAFISYNVEADRFLSLTIEKELFVEIKTHPEKFNQ